MHILCLGINHTTAAVSLRERLAFSEEQIRAALARLGCSAGLGNVAEMIILSTCNRIELYAASTRPLADELEAFLSEAHNMAVDEFSTHLYRFAEAEAVCHLLEVAAGLDSLVLGEPQILGQVTRALELARGAASSGPVLSRLFQTAIHAGKRARTETCISHNPASVSSLAAALAERAVPNVCAAQMVVLGAGEMAELAVEGLTKRGASRILVVNRTLEHARALAERWGAESATFESLESAVSRADILIASTGAPHTLISAAMVAEAMRLRPERPLALIDIAVPRDIDPETAAVPGVKLFDMDGLNAQLEQSLALRTAEVPQVRAILAEEQAGFMEYLDSLEMLPLIAELRQHAESIRQAELQKTLRRLPDLTEAERARVEALTEALVRKLLDAPTARLRREAACPHAPAYATVTRTLFGVDKGHTCHFSGQECHFGPAD
ncbi:MAG: glutamyl-tRNA reductase [Anaerolineales bacterium]|nr:glutamyl-tRNA reductase [Anaerolineales bacterium]